MNSMHHFLTPPNAALDNLSGEIRNEVEFNLLAEVTHHRSTRPSILLLWWGAACGKRGRIMWEPAPSAGDGTALRSNTLGKATAGIDDPAIPAKSWLDVRPDQRSSTED